MITAQVGQGKEGKVNRRTAPEGLGTRLGLRARRRANRGGRIPSLRLAAAKRKMDEGEAMEKWMGQVRERQRKSGFVRL